MQKELRQEDGSFSKFLSKVLFLFKGGESKEQVNEELVNFGLGNQETPKEHDADWKPLTAVEYQTILDAVDNTNEAIHEYYTKSDDKSADEWGGDKLRDLAGEVDPTLTDVHQKDLEIEKGLDEIIIDESKDYAAEMVGRELSVDELKEAEKED